MLNVGKLRLTKEVIMIKNDTDSHAGYHQFHDDETQESYGSFEVYENNGGWFWQPGFPGCLADGDPTGPFATSQQAHEDADEWSPDYDEAK
jgi:hypothetical protein